MDDRERYDAEHLNRLWDATLDSEPVRPDGELGEAITALHAADDAPDPDPLFLARLRHELLAGREPAAARRPRGAQPIGLISPSPAILPRPMVLRIAIAAIAAALLIAALSGGSRWLAGSGPAPMVASAMASAVPDRPTAVPTMIELPIDARGLERPAVIYPTVVPGLAPGAAGSEPKPATPR